MDYLLSNGSWLFMLVIVLAVQMIYAFISLNRSVKTEHYKSWRKGSIETSLTPQEFISRVQKICLHKNWNIVELTEQHAIIRTYPTFWGWGYFFYIDYLPGETTAVNVYTRGAYWKNTFYRPAADNLLWMFYQG